MSDYKITPDDESYWDVSDHSSELRHRIPSLQSYKTLTQVSLHPKVELADDDSVPGKGNKVNNLFIDAPTNRIPLENKIETMVAKVNGSDWSVCEYHCLPLWMQDNEYIVGGHRPPLSSFSACFSSIIRIHTETVNIWTHLLGCVMFIILAISFMLQPLTLQQKLVFLPFFAGAITCLGFSFAFHTVHCHSPFVVKVFSRLDYCGITLLITGSFVPWLYYSFFCHFWLKVVYLSITMVLGVCATVVSLSEKFSKPTYRSLRAAVFIVFGLSGIMPGVHFIFLEGWKMFFTFGTPLLLTAVLYILGAVIYALRVPERIFPGKCNIWFQSHQIFHVLVVIATLISYYGLVAVSTHQNSDPNYCPT